MAKPRHRLRVALLQVRDHPAAAAQELGCFLARCRLQPAQVRVINLVHQPQVSWSQVADVDAVMIGGAGSHTVTERYPFTERLFEVVARVLEEDRPFFGSCWGHQFMAQVLGGTVVTDEETKEVGTFEVTVTAGGHGDPLLAELPGRFLVQLGHKDRIEAEPPGLEVLATSARCRHQLIRVRDKPAYGSQFHSEMNDEDMRARLRMYNKIYLGDGQRAVAAFEESLRPSPVADRLLDRFLSLYT
jgi:GMP synthase (glutamine-hydrolysing)